MVGIAAALIAFTQVKPPQMTPSEAKTAAALRKAGGRTEWVQEDDWNLCLDLQNKETRLDLKCIVGLKRLGALRIFGGGINESSLGHLSQLGRLKLLVLLTDGLSDSGLKKIGKISSLEKLDVKSHSLTAKGLHHLLGLRQLRRLYLYNTKLRDEQIGPLKMMNWLRVLDLPLTVTQDAVSELKKALPDTAIERINS